MNICISEDHIRGGCYKGGWSPRAEMSGNQKQAPQVVPQARFPQGSYIPNLQRPPTPHNRSDVFHVGNQQYVPQQQPPPPNIPGNPGQIRNMGPTGPPNQTSTPPNADLKVSHVQQQTAMNMQFIPRGGGYFRPQGQATGRVMNRAQNQHQNMYPAGSQLISGFSQVPQMAFYNMGYPQRHVLQNYQLVGNQISYQYPHAAPQTQSFFPQYNAINVQRQPPTPQVPPMQLNMGHPPQPNVSISSSPQPNNQNNKRPKAIPIIDPKTNSEIDMNENTVSSPLSGESSACQTPQPTQINSSKEVQAIFAKKVAQSLSEEVPSNCIAEYDAVAPQGSKLQVPKKDFVPASTINKESFTPVVSAKTNCEERTIVNKPQQKDRESPVKSIRKQKEPTIAPKENKEVKEKEISVEKPVIQENITENPSVLPPSTTPPAPVVSSPSVIKEIKEKENIVKEEKQCLKKDKMDSNKLVEISPAQEVTKEQSFASTVVPTVQQPDAKTKQTPHMKEVPKQSGTTQSQNLPKSQIMKAAPPLQPTKQTTKVIKEANNKGTNKEATVMEALPDNIDSNIMNTPAAVTSDKTTPISVNNQDMNKASKADESVTINTVKPEMNTREPKSKVDVTDIVKEKPRPFVAPAPVESKDETDRAAVNNEKIVQVKNEMNAKSNTDSEESADAKSVLPYKENQWSPYNKDGKKQYEKDFLIALRNFPMSKQKPDNILNEIVAQDDKSRLGDVSRYGGRNDFAPSFGGGMNFSGKSSSQRGVPTKRGSQQGKIGGGGGSKGGKSGSTIRVSISIKEDVKLHETENAWKPARINSVGGVLSDEDKKTEELYKKVRGVLNKLTPQKFATLIDQIKSLPIDTTNRLQGVIDLVFEKAVDEPNFSVAYALMCKELALMEVPVARGSTDCVNFRKLLITRCQEEFERNSYEETTRNEKLKEIGECTDPEKKKELTFILEEDDRRLRRKSVGNIRFIGELFKQQMLTVSIMMRCLYILLENKDEERLECLCKLLSTVGKELENRKVGLNDIFATMKEIADKNSNNKISSRVRFMLQDVIDLRLCSWIPRRQDLNPKTMDQIQKEAVNEQLTSQALNSGPITPRKEDSRGMNSNFGERKQRGNTRNTGEDGWSTATRGKNNMPFVQSDKLKIKQPNIEEPFGSAIAFGNWARGSNAKIPQPAPPTTGTNMFAALAVSGDHDSRTGGHRSSYKDSYNAKGSSLDRIPFKQYDGHGSRSGSQHRSNDNSHSNTPSPAQQVLPPSKPPMKPDQPDIKKAHKDVEKKLDEQARAKLIQQLKSTLTEYTQNLLTLNVCIDDFKAVPASELEFIVDELFNYLLDKSNDIRKKCGGVFAHLIISKTLQLESFAQIIEKSFSYYEDAIVDIPNIWECYAQLISGSLIENALPLKVLFEKSSFLISKGVAHKLIALLFKLIVTEKGPNFLNEIWKSSNLKFSDFMDPSEVEKFVDTNNFGILSGKDGNTSSVQNIAFPEIGNKLRTFIKDGTSLDDIKSWVNANVGDGIKDKEFIKVLVTAVIENSVTNLKLDVEMLRKCFNLLLFYIDGNQEYELQCLYAIHSLVNKWEYPQGLLLKIFSSLYEESIISYEGFIAWRTNDGPAGQDRKGVAVKQLNSFFTQLFENDDEFTSDEELQK